MKPLEHTPSLIYGTAWKEDRTKNCVADALDAGFRAIDTANQRKHYFEDGVGEALEQAYAEGKLSREDLFLQTKYTYLRGQDHRLPYDKSASLTEQVQQSFASSLKHLRASYIDSYILHGPWQAGCITEQDLEVWSAMEALQREGLVKQLGISNIDLSQLQTLFENASLKPSAVQNRCYASLDWDEDVRGFCQQHGIMYQGFSLLTANRHVWQGEELTAFSLRYERTPAQIIFTFAAHIGITPLTGTTDLQHMQDALASTNITLTEEDFAEIATLR